MIMDNEQEIKNVGKTQEGLEQEEKEIQWTKDNNKWGHKVFATIWASVVVFIGILGLIFGKIVEATLFEEIAKWVVMAAGVGLVVCVICYVPVELMKLARWKLYPQYGKAWLKEALKEAIGKK